MFERDDPRFKPGMTVNLTIYIAEKADTLIAPRRALIQQGGNSYVQVLNGNRVEQRKMSLAGRKAIFNNGISQGAEITAYV